MLHIFLDTNILEDDPFLQQKKKLELLVKKGKAELLLPDVVIDELTKHTVKKSKESVATITKNFRVLNNIQQPNILSFQLKPFTHDEIKKKYNTLQSLGKIKILSSDNIKINRIMERYISEKKPFSENKESFRDYTLFCICADYVHDNKLSDCFFISENSTDFANKEKTDFHDDLKAESQGIKYVFNLRTFISLPEVQKKIDEIQEEEQYEKLVEDWINCNIATPISRNDEPITKWAIDNLEKSKYLYMVFEKKLYTSIENEIIDECMNAQPERFSSFFDSGYVDYEGINSIEEFDIQDFTASDDNSVTISGVIYLSVQVSIYAYNWCYERGDEDDSRYICLASGDVQMHYSFDLTINNDDKYDVSYNLENIVSDLGDNVSE